MNFRKCREMLLDNSLDIRERLFVLIVSVTAISVIVMLIENIATLSPMWDNLMLAIGLLVFVVLAWMSLKMKKLKIGAILISVIIVFIFLPVTFFTEDGIYGDAPLWFLFSTLFLSMFLSGKTMWIFLILDAVVAGVCYIIGYKYPDSVLHNSESIAHIDSFVSLMLIGSAISLIVTYEIKIYRAENEHSEKQRKEIELLSDAQNQFFSSMSHEIRTPINTIIGLNEMILRENISEEVAEDAANIQSAGKMLLSLINDILDMSKFRSGQMRINPAPYNTGDMLSEIVAMLCVRAREKKLAFHVNVAPDIPAELIGDEVRIKQILINVLNNAIKYTKEGSVSLSIQCGTEEDGILHVLYSVSDTGIGIKKENIPYIFDAFKRVDEDRNSHIEGTGLGLSIVKQFADLMGGKITVNSVYTKGTTFLVDIPQQVLSSKQIGDIDLLKQNNITYAGSYKKKFEAPEVRVLAVDDVASNLLVVSKMLRDTKVQIDTVSSGEEALKKTLNTYYDVIFMDHLMPEMDGIECHKRIRSQLGGRCRDSRIVALTANAGGENRKLYAKEGFDGYIEKPVSSDILEKELYRLIPGDKVYVSGDNKEILEETISWMETNQRKKHVVITTESVADLPNELTDKYDIAVIPHMIYTKEGAFKDGTEIETHGILRYMSDPLRKVDTSAPDVQMHEAFFARQLSRANNVVHIAVSSKLQNSGYPTAIEASRAFDNVTVVDSRHLSSSQGLMTIKACIMAESGMSPSEIAEKIEEMSSGVHTSFIVDNLDFLARAGQVKKRVADLIKSFMLRPVLEVKNGKIGVGGMYFGSRESAWEKYIQSVLRHKEDIDSSMLFVTYVGLSKREKEWIREVIEQNMKFDAIYFQQASPAVSVNCGPGTFGLLFCDKHGILQ